MELRTLRAFVEVVRQGGFSQAAKVVFATQSTVSKAVKQLVDELGVTLLERAGPRSSLTAAGEIVLRRAQAMLAERDDLLAELDELRGLRRGLLRLGLPPLGSSTLFALLPSSHPCAHACAVTFPQLAASPFILFESGFALNAVILGACERHGLTPQVAARSAQIDFIVALVAAGLGIGFLPRMIAEQRAHPGVAQVPLAEPGTDWSMALIWRRGGYLSDAARAWLALVREHYSGTPGQPSARA